MSFKQGLFWKNMPCRIPDKRANFVFSVPFLKQYKLPLMVFTGTNNINFNRFPDREKFRKKIQKFPIEFFLYEPVSYYFTNEDYNLGFYSEFHNSRNTDIKLRAKELDCIQDFAEKYSCKINVNLCDYNIPKHFKSTYKNLNLATRDIFIRQNLPAYKNKSRVFKDNISKKFFCSNGRYTIHRHIIMCYLSHFEGYYSWWFDCDTNWSQYVDWVENLPQNYLEEGNKILTDTELEIDVSHQKIQIDYLPGFHKPEFEFSKLNEKDYLNKMHESFVCVVNETRFAQPSANISEKTITAIVNLTPFILVAPPFSLHYLRELGFKTFSNFWDESYDTERNHSARLKKIFAIFNKINAMTYKEINNLYKEMKPVLKHNQKKLNSLKTNYQKLNAYEY